MTTFTDYSPRNQRTDWSQSLRTATILVILLLVFISLKPFPDLASPEAIDGGDGRDVNTYLAFAALACVCLWQTTAADWRYLRAAIGPPHWALAMWILATSIISQAPVTSIKRAALTGFVVSIAVIFPLLPRSRAALARQLAVASAIILTLCYVSVFLFPRYAVHQATDLVEPHLAGSWRGLFDHKNEASAVLSIFVFIGLFVAQCGMRIAGRLIAVLSFLFVIGTDGKSSLMLCCVAVLASMMVTAGRSPRLGLSIAALPLLALNIFGVGSTLSAAIAALTSYLPFDPSFTGRVDVWRFAVSQLPGHLSHGYGFSTFWNSDLVRMAGADAATWAGEAAHAHNGYLDSVLAMGAPGLALVAWAFILRPARDIAAAIEAGADRALITLFTQIWLFGLYLSALESFFFDRSSPIWFSFLLGIFGLRYVSQFRTRSDEERLTAPDQGPNSVSSL